MAISMKEHTSLSTCSLSAPSTLSATFSADPVIRWLLTQSPKTYSLIEDPIFFKCFLVGTIALSLSGKSTVTEIHLKSEYDESDPTPTQPQNDSASGSDSNSLWPCIAITTPPGCSCEGSFLTYLKIWRDVTHVILGAKLSTSIRILFTYPNIQSQLKKNVFSHPRAKETDLKKRFEKEGWYYLFFLGTIPELRRKGLASDYVREVQRLASEYTEISTSKKDKGEEVKKPKCIYLETSTRDAKRLYEKLGFECLGEVTMGEGWVDENGFVKEREGDDETGGGGVKLWAMVWFPEQHQEENIEKEESEEK